MKICLIEGSVAMPDRKNAFSLIEVVLALGIISFAIVGIMGLMPVAMKSAQESQRETRATLIAEQIYSDLSVAKGPIRKVTIQTNAVQVTLDLTASSTNTIYFNDVGYPLGLSQTSDSMFLAELAVIPGIPVAGISRVQVSVQTPVAAPRTNRAKFEFITLLRSTGS